MAPSEKKPIQSVGVGVAIPSQVTTTDAPAGADVGAVLRIVDDGIADGDVADAGMAPAKSSRATASAVVEQALSLPVASTALTETK